MVRSNETGENKIEDNKIEDKKLPSVWERFSKAAGGDLNERLSIALPVFFLGIACLFLWAIIDYLF